MKVRLSIYSLLILLSALTILTLPIAKLHIGKIGITLSIPNIFLLLFLGLWIMSTFGRKPPRITTFKNLFVMAGILLIWITITSLLGESFKYNFDILLTIFGAFLFFIIGTHLGFSSINNPNTWGIPLLLGGLTAALVGIGHYTDIVPLFEFERKAARGTDFYNFFFKAGHTGLITTRGDYNIWLLATMMFAFRLLVTRKRFFIKILAVAAVAVIITAIVFSLSRSGWLSLMATLSTSLMLKWILKGRHSYLYIQRLLFASIALVLFLCVLLAMGVIDNFLNELVSMREASVQGRLSGYWIALDYFLDHPIIGNGGIFITNDGVVHNTFIHLLVSYGFPAFLFFVLLIFKIIVKAIDVVAMTNDMPRKITVALWLAWLAGTLISLSLYQGIMSKYFWCAFGIMCGEIYAYTVQTPSTGQRKSHDSRSFFYHNSTHHKLLKQFR